MLWGLKSSLSRRWVQRTAAARLFSNRPQSNTFSLDANFAATHPDVVIAHLQSRKSDNSLVESVGQLGALRVERNKLIVQGDSARSKRKTLSKDIGQLMKSGKKDAAEQLKQQVEECSRIAAEADAALVKVDADINVIVSLLPNLLDDRVPEGQDDSDNVVVHTWGAESRKVAVEGQAHPYLWHDEIAHKLGGSDGDAAARIAGARFSVLVGPLARLERALIQFFLDFHTTQRGYTEVSVPYIVSRSTLMGTGQLPKFEDDLFKVSHTVHGEDAFLIPTAEVPVTNLFREQLLDISALPLRLVCHSPSFRAEAGSYGKDTRGLLRQHQFHKVELVKICTPDTSAQEHEDLVKDAEALLEVLKLPYRRVLLCAGDTGFGARICYDLEVWLPGQQAYREISSCSNCGDFQSRRMSLRYKDRHQSGGNSSNQSVYPHTLNGSGMAVGRALVAILENYQAEDGSGDVIVPEVLRKYLGGIEVLRAPRGSNNSPNRTHAPQNHTSHSVEERVAMYHNTDLLRNRGDQHQRKTPN